MTPRTIVTLATGALLLAAGGACGGKLGDGSNSKEDSKEQARPDGAGGQGEDGDDGQQGADDIPTSDRTLEACEKGFLHEDSPGRPCPYIADGRCYDSPEAACDCVCPREGQPNCVWYAFLDPIEVTCENL